MLSCFAAGIADKTTSRIDLRSFEGTDASDRNWEKKTADQLEKIAKALSQLTDVEQRSLKISITSIPEKEE